MYNPETLHLAHKTNDKEKKKKKKKKIQHNIEN
jgi:hypothetical protein